jgi:hypothetical protein
MDSNENTEDKILDSSSEMEVSDSSVQDKKSEKPEDKVSLEKMVLKENIKSEGLDIICEKVQETKKETKKETMDTEDTDNVKINTQNNSKTVEVEKKKEIDRSVKVSNSLKDMDNSEMETTTSIPIKELKEGKRKRKSTM